MNITNETNSNFDLLTGSQNEKANKSILNSLFSTDFSNGFTDKQNKSSVNEFIFKDDEIKIIDYIFNTPILHKNFQNFLSFDKIENLINSDANLTSEEKYDILKFLHSGKIFSKNFQLNFSQNNNTKSNKNLSFIKVTTKKDTISDYDKNYKNKIFDKHTKQSDSIPFSDKKKIDGLDTSQSNLIVDSKLSKNRKKFVKKIKNNHPNKIYKSINSSSNNFDQLKDDTSEIKNKIFANVSTTSMLNSSTLDKIKKNINEVKSNTNQSLNVNPLSNSGNNGQSFSQNNDTLLNSNNYNSVLENFLDHLDLSQKGWTNKLVSRIGNALIDGGEQIEFNLKPRNLGVLKVSVSQKNGISNVKILTENSFVTSALTQNESYLQKLFNDQGMNLDFTAENDSQAFGSKHNFEKDSDKKNKSNNDELDLETKNKTDEKFENNSSDNVSSRHVINVIA